MKISDCTPGDLPSIKNIFNYYVLNSTATFLEKPFSDSDMLAKYNTVIEQGYPWLTAKNEQGEIAGYAYASAFRAGSAYRLAEITIYLHPDKVGKGVGSMLYKELLPRLMSMPNVFGIMAAIMADNTGSIEFHKRFGFKSIGIWKNAGYKFGHVVDVDLLELLTENCPSLISHE